MNLYIQGGSRVSTYEKQGQWSSHRFGPSHTNPLSVLSPFFNRKRRRRRTAQFFVNWANPVAGLATPTAPVPTARYPRRLEGLFLHDLGPVTPTCVLPPTPSIKGQQRTPSKDSIVVTDLNRRQIFSGRQPNFSVWYWELRNYKIIISSILSDREE